MKRSRPIVLKFGSSVLRGPGDLSAAVHEIYRYLRAGRPVVAVVSAMGDTTDRLFGEARAIEADPDSTHLPELLATGERASAAMLCLALERSGIPARGLDAAAVGLRCAGSPLDARPIEVDEHGLHAALAQVPVVVLPGFIGVRSDGALGLFGRGGTDLSAIFLAGRLGAECRLLKDVEGLFDRDPALPGPPPRLFRRIRWSDALALDGGIVQHKAVRYAREHGLEFDVAAVGRDRATRVGRGPSRFATARGPEAPLRIALLGVGSVGAGVHRLLSDRPEDFEIVSVLARDREKERGCDLSATRLVSRLDAVFDEEFDVLVELIGGVDLAAEAVESSLGRGRHVVTANKALLAARGVDLDDLARTSGARLLGSAAVGGALPALERVRAAVAVRPLVGFEGVLNGTTNFVLDHVHRGAALDASVRRACELGFAEADPRLDLDGTDCAQKVELLARAANPRHPPVQWRERDGIVDYARARAGRRAPAGCVPRLVAKCDLHDGAPAATLRVEELPADNPFARLRGVENSLVLHFANGEETRLTGRGAGRWPTAESVLGDLYELRAARAREETV